ncbi:MAG: ankyrin repeat domain-containing protein, partial [Puniceicoccales bacterium]|nr:ankyrin repeat domain-containing protein [Puniceicoccales bacterium]
MNGKRLLKSIVWSNLLYGSCLSCAQTQVTNDEVTKNFLSLVTGESLRNVKYHMHEITEWGEPNNKLYWAIRFNNVPVIKRLLKKSIDLNHIIPSSHAQYENEGETPLEQAIGNPKLVKLFLNHGADPNLKRINKYGHEIIPLGEAVEAGAVETVKLLLSRGADPHWKDLQNRTLLHIAISDFCTSSNSLQIAELLLDQGIDPNSKDNAGRVPLAKLMCHILSETDAYHSYVWEMELLLDQIDLHSRDKIGQVPLTRLMSHMLSEKDAYPHHVWEMEHQALCRYQICRRRELIERTSQGINCCFQIIKLFVDRSADINIQDNEGNTLLHWAIPFTWQDEKIPTLLHSRNIHPNLELFETLIELGADVNIPNHEGKTPLDLLLQRKEE